ncbi:hypothetical protein BGAL_0006g00040 [Botrytis galanthina]|uniref:Rhodopsin domain-containing protein n=1 Tax=Botrytis galanthina TaxID=278940 RepID=A0A4S8RE06_9HELO|nr:hypothetical protein BGAL_0006g00040 [Botrytis galanthina]
MSTAGFFHTPVYPGVNLDANEGPKINSVSGVFIGISLITIFVRVFSRWWTKIGFWVDDYLILVGAAFSIAYSALLIFEVQHNYYGQHIGKMDIPHLMSFVKGLYVATIMYPIALTFSKLSLLALYWRIFRVPKGQMPFIVAAAVNIAWMTAALTLICTSLYLAKGSSKVDDVDAGLWAAIELNTWVLVASIPTFKPIIVKILKDRKARQAAASGNHADYSKSISTNKGYKRSEGSSFPSTTSGDQLDLVERCAIRENSSQNEMELDVRG